MANRKRIIFGGVITVLCLFAIAVLFCGYTSILVQFDPGATSFRELYSDKFLEENTVEYDFDERNIISEYTDILPFPLANMDEVCKYHCVVYKDTVLFGERNIIIMVYSPTMNKLSEEGYDNVAGSGMQWLLKYSSKAAPKKYWLELK